MFSCPGCGEDTETLYEGYCEECRDERQHALLLHQTEYDHWKRMSSEEREHAIRNACRALEG
jgi:hypothetical protein